MFIFIINLKLYLYLTKIYLNPYMLSIQYAHMSKTFFNPLPRLSRKCFDPEKSAQILFGAIPHAHNGG